MERAGRLIPKLKLSPAINDPETRARAAWNVAVGKKIAAHTRATVLVRDSLIVEVEDYVWQRQLATLEGVLLRNLEKALGEALVKKLDFRPMPRAPHAAEGGNGAAGIRDRGPHPRFDLPAESQMKITPEEVRRVAELADLALGDDEIARMAHDLDEILTHIDKLNELDTTGVEPMAQVLYEAEETATLREDRERPTLGNALALKNAPLSGAGYYKVPKVIERG